MATMTAPEKNAVEVQEHLQSTAGKIRLHDLTVGGLLMVVTLLAYVAVLITLDKWLTLDATLRQLGWLALAASLAVIAYRYLLQPLRLVVNPLYAAKRVEETVDDAKNSVVNWVDLHDATMPESVRNAVAARAAKHLANADPNRATESRLLIYSGSAVAALVVILAVLFLTFKPTVFASLVGRALNPFSSSPIAARTSLTLLQPTGGDTTITAGTPLTIAVSVDGREPDAAAPDRVRALLRHNVASDSFEEVNLEPTGNREWSIRVPQHLVQNGFWYRVAGGDAVTSEHKVTVRPRPVFTAYEVKYEYPAYLNLKSETTKDPHIEAYRGTVVTLTAKANRDLKDGRMVVTDVAAPVLGTVKDDTLTVKFTLMENGTYRLMFTATTDEANTDANPHLLRVLSDVAPTVTFKPTQAAEQTLPQNGLLTIDATANDDFGVEAVTLKMRVAGGPALKDKPYQNGASFRRESDGSWPTSVEYKDSVKLETLNLKEGTLIEYWLEATDNCTVPKANVGKSKVLTVKLGPPLLAEDAKADQAKKVIQRGQDEKALQDKQAKMNQSEPRPKQAGPQEKKTNPEPNPAKPDENATAKPDEGANPKPEDTGTENAKPAAGGNDPAPKDADLKNQAADVRDELNKMKNEPGNSKSGNTPPSDEPSPAAVKKPGDNGSASDTKPMPDEGNPGSASGAKPEGAKPEPEAKSEPKPDAGSEASQGKPGAGDPVQEPGGSEKPMPQPSPMNDPAGTPRGQDPKNTDPNAASKPDSVKKLSTEKGPAGGDDAKAGAPGDGKNQTPPKPSTSKPGGDDPKTGGTAASESKDPGGVKPESQASASESKPASPGQAGATEKPAGGSQNQPDWDEAKRELSSENPGKQEAARQQLEDQIGRDRAKEAESLFRDLKSNDPEKRAEAEKKLDKLKKKTQQEQPSTGSGDQQAGSQSLSDAMKDQAKRDAEQLSKDLQSPDAGTKAKAEKKVDELKKKAEENAQKNQQGGDHSKAVEQAAKDLKSGDGAKKDAAGKAMEQAMKDQAAKEAQQLAKDLQSKDPATQAAAQKKLDDIRKEMAKQPQGGENSKAAEQAAKDLKNGDAGQHDAAGQALDKAMKEQAAKEAQQLAKDLQSKDAATKAAAEKKVDDLKNQMAKQKSQPGEASKAIDDAAKGMQSGDAEKRDAAKEAMTKAMQEQAAKDAEQLAKDLQSKDATTKAAAEKRAEDLKNEMAKQGGGQQSKDAKETAKAMEDLKSKDEQTRQQAAEKLNEAARKAAEQKFQELAKDLQSGDAAEKAAAEQQLADALNEMAKNPPMGDPQPKDAKDIAKDLNSLEGEKNRAAKEAIKKAVTEQAKNRIDQLAKDMQSNDPAKKEAAEKQAENLKQMFNELAKNADKLRSGSPGSGGDTTGTPLKADDKFARNSGQLQLEDLKKEELKKRLMENKGWTQEEYDNFVKGYTKMLNRTDEVNAEATVAKRAEVPKINTGGAEKVETRAGVNATSPQHSGPAYAPAGYSEAQKKFLEAARKAQEQK